MNRHRETFLRIDELGSKFPSYKPTFDFPGQFIDSSHRRIACSPVQDGILIQIRHRRWFGKAIPGWLRREDALKLYELSYFASGDILELGCYHGLSTSILARAKRNSEDPGYVCTVDLNPSCINETKHTLKQMGLHRFVTSICDDAAAVARRCGSQGKCFGFVFIDHSHAFEPMYDLCRELARIITPGGFCLFHDFNDPRNRDPDDKDYGVYQAVMRGLDDARFEFWGIYGCTGLYRAIAVPE
jgi:predicted O-methyltransferase YrrM